MDETALLGHSVHRDAVERIGLVRRVPRQTGAVESADPVGDLVAAARHNLQGPCPGQVHGFHPSALAGAEKVDLKERSAMQQRVASAGPEPVARIAVFAKVVGHPETALQVVAIQPEAQLADATEHQIEATASVEPEA